MSEKDSEKLKQIEKDLRQKYPEYEQHKPGTSIYSTVAKIIESRDGVVK